MRREHELFLMGIVEIMGYSPIDLPQEEEMPLEDTLRCIHVSTSIRVVDNILYWRALGILGSNTLHSLPYGGQCVLTTQYGIIPNGYSVISTDGMYDPWRTVDTSLV